MMQRIELWEDDENIDESCVSYVKPNRRKRPIGEYATDDDGGDDDDDDDDDGFINSSSSTFYSCPGRIELPPLPPPKRLCRRSPKVYVSSSDDETKTNMTQSLVDIYNSSGCIESENRNFDRAANNNNNNNGTKYNLPCGYSRATKSERDIAFACMAIEAEFMKDNTLRSGLETSLLDDVSCCDAWN